MFYNPYSISFPYKTINSRHFNNVRVVENPLLTGQYCVIKESQNVKKLKAEYSWYQFVYAYAFYTQNYNVYFPTVSDFFEDKNYAHYTLPYIDGNTLSDLLLADQSDRDLIKFVDFSQFFYDLKRFIEDSVFNIEYVYDYDKMLVESMYTVKTFQRLNEYGIDLDKSYIINGIKTPTLRELVNQSYVEVNNCDIKALVHGDLCFSNIIIPFHSTQESKYYNQNIAKYQNDTTKIGKNDIVLIDPRGMLPSNKITPMGDMKYDVGKLAHSVIGLYDNIVTDKGFYVNKINDNEYTYYIKISENQENAQEQFKQVFCRYERYYYDIMIHLFLSMIPLHRDRPDHQEKMLVNAFRIYFMKHNIIL